MTELIQKRNLVHISDKVHCILIIFHNIFPWDEINTSPGFNVFNIMSTNFDKSTMWWITTMTSEGVVEVTKQTPQRQGKASYHCMIGRGYMRLLTYPARVTHICVSRHWFRLWIVVWPAPTHFSIQSWNFVNWNYETNFSENLIAIYTFPFRKMHLKMSCGK